MDQFVTQATLQTWYKKQEKGEIIDDSKQVLNPVQLKTEIT